MSATRSKFWLYRWLLHCKRSNASGFTLLEILISLLIASIVVTGLLYLVVELLSIDRRELALEQVQRDMQRASDYIADDLREAVYVYSDPGDLDALVAQLTDLQTKVDDGDAIPVLAFWRPVYVDAEDIGSSGGACAANSTTCNLIKTRGATYSLVVYYQAPADGTVQEGKSHIRRYELKEYKNINTLTVTPNYKSPIDAVNGTQFENWTAGGTISANDTDDVALVDYVAEFNDPDEPTQECDFYTSTPLTTATANDYQRLPSTAATSPSNSFFVCVRDSTPTDLSDIGQIAATAAADAGLTAFRSRQDVFIYLRGDAQGSGSTSTSLQPASEASRLPIIQTQVLLGGVINEDSIN